MEYPNPLRESHLKMDLLRNILQTDPESVKGKSIPSLEHHMNTLNGIYLKTVTEILNRHVRTSANYERNTFNERPK